MKISFRSEQSVLRPDAENECVLKAMKRGGLVGKKIYKPHMSKYTASWKRQEYREIRMGTAFQGL